MRANQAMVLKQPTQDHHTVDPDLPYIQGCFLLTQEYGAEALTQQGEVGVGPGLDHRPVTEEDEGDGPRKDYVEPLARSLQDLLSGHSLVTRVDGKRHAWIARRTQPTGKRLNISIYISINIHNVYVFYFAIPILLLLFPVCDQ